MPPPSQDWKRPLVWLVGAIFLAGAVVGLFVAGGRSPSYALGSVEIGAVVVGALLDVARLGDEAEAIRR